MYAYHYFFVNSCVLFSHEENLENDAITPNNDSFLPASWQTIL